MFRLVRKSLLFSVAVLGPAAILSAQNPVISSLESSPIDGNPPFKGPAITAGTPANNTFGAGFELIINGTFDASAFISVTWESALTGLTFFNEFCSSPGCVLSAGPSQIIIEVPQSLYASATQATVTVQEFISASETSVSSNAATFTVNPPLAPPQAGQLLPIGTVGVPYGAPFFTGGTGPYSISLNSGATPPGLPLPANSNFLAGTPSSGGTGLYQFSPGILDAWGNSLTLSEAIEIVAIPVLSAVNPPSVAAGTNGVTVFMTGTNLIAPVTAFNSPIAGSTVQFSGIGPTGPVTLALTTTYIGPTQVSAVIPAVFLQIPQTASLSVVQPNGAVSSNSLPFTVFAPSIVSVAPSPVTVRSPAPTITVTGSNFVNGSQVLVNGSAVPTAFVNSGSLTFTAPTTLGAFAIMVQNPGQSTSNTATLTVLPAPALTSLSPNTVTSGQGFTLTINGTNFTNTMQALWNGIALPTTFVSGTQLRATVAAALAVPGTAQVSISTSDNYVTPAVALTITSTLQITTVSLPSATSGTPYNTRVNATGGTPPYIWSATGLPSGLSINRTTGDITGTTSSTGSSNVTVTVIDSKEQTVSAQFPISVIVPIQPVSITTLSPLPDGQINTPYKFVFSATDGTAPYTWKLFNAPANFSLAPDGTLSGTPAIPGQFTFTVQVTDKTGANASSSFTLNITPATLTITTLSPLADIVSGTAVNFKFAATGGVPPYSFGLTSGTLPPGLTLAKDGTLSGTPNAAGTFTFSVTVTDNAQKTAAKTFTVTVTAPVNTITPTSVNAQVGTALNLQFNATGGQAPYTWSAAGLPGGLSISNSGVLSGTPAADGSFTISLTVTDAAGNKKTQNVTVTVALAPLTVSGTTLPGGVASQPYSGTVTATGGTAPYTFSASGLPPGITLAANGTFSGTPTASGTFSVTITVTDAKGQTSSKTLTLIVAPQPLQITTATLANPVAGAAYSATLAATGGVPPLTWSATGLPAGLSISSAGVITGTVTTPGASSVVVTVKDSAGTTTTQTYTLTTVLPATPPVSLTGLPATGTPGSQSNVQVGLGSTYPVPVTVNLTLTFTPDSGADDPTVQFATGGRTAQLTIAAGATVSTATVGVQTGTVAGTATITAQLVASGQNITPSPAPRSTVRIAPAAPSLTSVTATATSTGFTVTVIGFSTPRQITQAIFTFTPAGGATLQTNSVTIPVTSIFSSWYGSTAAAAFGSQFLYTQPFTVQGGSIASVTVTLVNDTGSSTPVTATVK